MPTLVQIQNYVKYRRTLGGNTNDVDKLKAKVNELRYTKDTPPNELFIFGDEVYN
jgi:hypothetical protein